MCGLSARSYIVNVSSEKSNPKKERDLIRVLLHWLQLAIFPASYWTWSLYCRFRRNALRKVFKIMLLESICDVMETKKLTQDCILLGSNSVSKNTNRIINCCSSITYIWLNIQLIWFWIIYRMRYDERPENDHLQLLHLSIGRTVEKPNPIKWKERREWRWFKKKKREWDKREGTTLFNGIHTSAILFTLLKGGWTSSSILLIEME